ncbi:MAG: YfcE family phosphodiesterase [Oscillospiraceae bacterium]|jgi:putative phosphoesterase|nr:YfcE family phosphodiesterase [Oscillospiraceae bacterium]
MRILVCSDSHGRGYDLLAAAEAQPSAEILVFLGDGENDSDAWLSLPGKKLHRVRGNCDFVSSLPDCTLFQVADKRVLCAHGHLYRVKHGLEDYRRHAREAGVQIALFGHTHTPYVDYADGLYLFNPGAIRDKRYGFVDITDAGTVCGHCQL